MTQTHIRSMSDSQLLSTIGNICRDIESAIAEADPIIPSQRLEVAEQRLPPYAKEASRRGLNISVIVQQAYAAMPALEARRLHQ